MASVAAISALSCSLTASAATSAPHVAYLDKSVDLCWTSNGQYYVNYRRGDLNRDGMVNASDFEILLAYTKQVSTNKTLVVFDTKDPSFALSGKHYSQYDFIRFYGDVNADGKVNASDVTLFAAHIHMVKPIDTSYVICTFR